MLALPAHSNDPIRHLHPVPNWRVVDLAIARCRSGHRHCAAALDRYLVPLSLLLHLASLAKLHGWLANRSKIATA
jgi:hypothetical protein